MTSKQKGFSTIGTIALMVLALPFASAIWLKAITANQIYSKTSETPATELAVVLGAAAYNVDTPSDILKDRLDTALELYSEHKVSKIFVTGAANETETMKKYLQNKSVPIDSILEDPKGLNTLASIQNIPKTYHKITIVTQRYHLPRAIFYAEHLGFEANGAVADRHEYIKMFDFKKRELLAASKAVWDVLLNVISTKR